MNRQQSARAAGAECQPVPLFARRGDFYARLFALFCAAHVAGCSRGDPPAAASKEQVSLPLTVERPIIRPKPERIAKKEAMAGFLTENCEVISGTAPIEEARVIGFGLYDSPNNRDDDDFLFALQLLVMEANELILTEGRGPDEEVDDPLRYLPQPAVVRGWDDKELHAESLRLFDEFRSLKERSQESREGDSSDHALLAEEVRRVHEIRRHISALMLRRNESMKRTVVASLEQYKRIWVRAGIAHFTLDPSIDAVLEGVPFLLLARKEDLESHRRTQQRLRELDGKFDKVFGDR